MTGAWAREADATDLTHLIDDGRLCDAAWSLAAALALSTPGARYRQLLIASAIIRRERKRLDPEGKRPRLKDWPRTFSDENLIWAALRIVATTDASVRDEDKAWHLRHAETALRTLHKRGAVMSEFHTGCGAYCDSDDPCMCCQLGTEVDSLRAGARVAQAAAGKRIAELTAELADRDRRIAAALALTFPVPDVYDLDSYTRGLADAQAAIAQALRGES